MIEMLGLGEEVVNRETSIVAVQRVHPRLDVEAAAFNRIEGRDSAEPAERSGEERGKPLVEELPVIVEKRIGVKKGGRHDLADRVLEAVVGRGSGEDTPV